MRAPVPAAARRGRVEAAGVLRDARSAGPGAVRAARGGARRGAGAGERRRHRAGRGAV